LNVKVMVIAYQKGTQNGLRQSKKAMYVVKGSSTLVWGEELRRSRTRTKRTAEKGAYGRQRYGGSGTGGLHKEKSFTCPSAKWVHGKLENGKR